jgi:hypothetical protein
LNRQDAKIFLVLNQEELGDLAVELLVLVAPPSDRRFLAMEP